MKLTGKITGMTYHCIERWRTRFSINTNLLIKLAQLDLDRLEILESYIRNGELRHKIKVNANTNIVINNDKKLITVFEKNKNI